MIILANDIELIYGQNELCFNVTIGQEKSREKRNPPNQSIVNIHKKKLKEK